MLFVLVIKYQFYKHNLNLHVNHVSNYRTDLLPFVPSFFFFDQKRKYLKKIEVKKELIFEYKQINEI